MIRTQIYLTKKEIKALRTIAQTRGVTQSEIIREAIDEYIAAHRQSDRLEMLRAARGMWAGRSDVDLQAMRREFDRSPGAED